MHQTGNMTAYKEAYDLFIAETEGLGYPLIEYRGPHWSEDREHRYFNSDLGYEEVNDLRIDEWSSFSMESAEGHEFVAFWD